MGSRGASRALVGVAIVAGATLWVLGLWAYINHEPPSFFPNELATRAAAACREVLREFPSAPRLGPLPTFEERAERVESLLELDRALIARLRTIPGEDSSPEFQSWLDDYEAWVAIGQEYADAIRTGDPDVYVPAGNRGDRPQIELSRTASANGVLVCLGGTDEAEAASGTPTGAR